MTRLPVIQVSRLPTAASVRKVYATHHGRRRALHTEPTPPASTASPLPIPHNTSLPIPRPEWIPLQQRQPYQQPQPQKQPSSRSQRPTPPHPRGSQADETILAEDRPQAAETHLFDTYEQVTQLQAWGGFSRSQAKAIMETLQYRLRLSGSTMSTELLANAQLENETYLIKAALAELKRDVQLLRQSDTSLLQTELTSLLREVETIDQRLNEDLGNMRADVELAMNDYRGEVREEQKTTEHQLREINNRLTVVLGDAATEIESLKWSVIWRGLLGGLGAALSISLIGYVLGSLRARVSNDRTRRRIQETENNLTYADMEIS